MNEQMKAKVMEWIAGLEKAGTAAVELGKQEIPAFLKEVVAYKITEGLIIIGFLASLSAFLIFITRHLIAVHKKNSADQLYYDGDLGVMAVFSGAGAIVTLYAASLYFLDVLKAYIAPRLFIIEWLRELVK
jgi:hypothetical protein